VYPWQEIAGRNSVENNPWRAVKIVLIVLGCVALVLCGIFAGTAISSGIKAGSFTSELRLAYAASTPQSKAHYVRVFIAKAENANLPEYAAWIIKRPENSIEMQFDILNGLAERCEQLATLNPESFGFAQGMTQITQDEFEYTLTDTKRIFAKAYRMQYGWGENNLWWVFIKLASLLFLGAGIAYVEGWNGRPHGLA
jgi:hypothetical protein